LRAGLASLVSSVALAGCVQQRAKPLTSDAFLAPHEVQDRSEVQPVDQPGPLVYEGTTPPAGKAPQTPRETAEATEGVSPTVEQSVRPVKEEGFQVPDAGAADAKAADDDGAPPETRGDREDPGRRDSIATTLPAGAPDSSGSYQLIGTVLADVNSAPVFADKVLGVLDKALAASAKQLDERPFRTEAAKLISKQVREYIYNELEFANAKTRLEARDQQLASAAAIRWREEQITRAGGSPEVTRQQWAAKGLDFEEQVEDMYRTYMVQLYYQRKEYPKIQVTAEDKRRYYQNNLAREFSQQEQARFRVIMIDPRKRGRREALGEINRLLDRARSGGRDFNELASAEATNDNPSFRTQAGWIVRGAFVVPEVEQAVWKLMPGEISGVIETADAFYLAKLEELQAARVLPFSDRAVQQKIENILRKQQFDALRFKSQQKLIRDAIIRYHPDEQTMLRTAVEMAVQKYNYWRAS
jgi:parvulin-like peptidyl-prolyl isomerase